MKSKLISTILAAAMTMTAVAFPAPIQMDAQANSLIVRKFDLGGLGAADGYIGVSASEAYDTSKGYGFANTDAVENVTEAERVHSPMLYVSNPMCRIISSMLICRRVYIKSPSLRAMCSQRQSPLKGFRSFSF